MHLEAFATVGSGLAEFAAVELADNHAENIQFYPGKVLFNLSSEYSRRALCLRSVERVFRRVDFLSTESWDSRQQVLDYAFTLFSKREMWLNCIDNVFSLRQSHSTSEMAPPEAKRVKVDAQHSFRLSCRCTGRWRHAMDAERLGRQLGRRLIATCNWISNLRSPDVEICLHISDCYMSVGIPFARDPVSKRPYMLHSGLRSTVCFAMASLANLEPGCVVLDPMCGLGTILLEVASLHPSVELLGSDCYGDRLLTCHENVVFARMTGLLASNHITFLQADVRRLPYNDKCVDRIICDVPFGKKVDNATHNIHTLYPVMLREMKRVLKSGGLLVLLISELSKEDMFLQASLSFLNLKSYHPIRLGNTDGAIAVFDA